MFKIADSDTQSLHAIEDEFGLARHRLSKFVAWKKKQPDKLLDIRLSDAERMQAARKKQKREALDMAVQWAAEREKAKWAAAAEIQQRYKSNLSQVILEAAREAIKGMHTHTENPVELEVSAKAVCLRTCSTMHACVADFIHRLRQPRTNMAICSITLCSQEQSSSMLDVFLMILTTFLYLAVERHPSSTIRMALNSLHF